MAKANKEVKKTSFWGDFKAFAMKGNMIDMAVGVIVGGAFGKIVSSLVSDVLMPPLGLLIGGVNFTDLKVTLKHVAADPATGNAIQAVTLNYGQFLQTIFDFFIIAMCIFLMIRMLTKITHPQPGDPAPAEPAPKPDDVLLLEEIRDLLKKQNSGITKK